MLVLDALAISLAHLNLSLHATLTQVLYKRETKDTYPHFVVRSLESIRVDSELPFQLLLEHVDQDDAATKQYVSSSQSEPRQLDD